jgi:hypothetical protein
MRVWTVVLLPATLLCRLSLAQETPVYKGKEEKLPQEVAPQPLPFSHKTHVASGIQCLDCHSGANKRERAGLPDAGQCMLCHQSIKTDTPAIVKLKALQEAGDKIEWVRVYKVPDFVFFSHSSHVNGGVECATCHGAVERRPVLAKEISTSMTTCMNCHAARGVDNHCHFCHSLGQ